MAAGSRQSVVGPPGDARAALPGRAARPGWPTIAALTVALAGPPALAAIWLRLAGDGVHLGLDAVAQGIMWLFGAFVLGVVVRWERLPLRSIGLKRPGWRTLATAAGLIVITLVVLPLATAPLMTALGQEGADAGVARLAPLPPWFRVFAGVTAGIVEEILYRGYAIERLHAITGRLWLGAAIAAVAFGAGHVPFWGVGFSLAADLPFGVLMVLAYVWRRDLLANMLAHSAGAAAALLAIGLR